MVELSKESVEYFNAILKALHSWVPSEYDRKWSVVKSDNILHANSRCPEVGGEDSWNLRKGDLLDSKTLLEITNYKNHCSHCIDSYNPKGFSYEWFGKVYQTVIIYDRYVGSKDENFAFYQLSNFKYSDCLSQKQEREMFEIISKAGLARKIEFNKEVINCVKAGSIEYRDDIDYKKSIPLYNGYCLISANSAISEYTLRVPENGDFEKTLEIFYTLLSDAKDRYGYGAILRCWEIALSLSNVK